MPKQLRIGRFFTAHKAMKIKDEYTKLVAQREKIEEIVDWNSEPVIVATIALFTTNLQETIDFLDNDCTADQFSWMSEVFDKISEKLQSWDFIDVLRRTAAKYPKETKKYNVLSFIETAEGMLSDEVYAQRVSRGHRQLVQSAKTPQSPQQLSFG